MSTQLPYTYQAKVLLDESPLTCADVIKITGWPPGRVSSTLAALVNAGVARMVNLGGSKMHYELA